MENVVALNARRGAGHLPDHSLKALRTERNMTLVQAAAALGVSPSTIESWEKSPHLAPCEAEVENRYSEFLDKNGTSAGNNLIFGIYPLRLARELLGLSILEMGEKLGYKEASWKRIEANTRTLSREKIKLIEDEVKTFFGKICSGE